MAGIVALIALIRILDVVLPREVWLPYVVLGAIFLGAGAVPLVEEDGSRPSMTGDV